jgi:hypothetical protein
MKKIIIKPKATPGKTITITPRHLPKTLKPSQRRRAV